MAVGSMLIDSRDVGKVIGTKGLVVTQLEHEFKVSITIAKEDGPPGQRKVDLRGADEDIMKAISAIKHRFHPDQGFLRYAISLLGKRIMSESETF